jgi:tetratricopeptide (TPR) repeat protein
MKIAVLAAALSLSIAAAAAAQSSTRAADAYAQFLLGHHLEDGDDIDGAITAYKKAMDLDPSASEIPAELAALYLRQNKVQDAMTTAEQALKIAPDNAEANRVLGIVYAALADAGGRGGGRGRTRGGAASGNPGNPGNPGNNDENLVKAMHYLEQAIAHASGEADPNVRATLARVYLQSDQFEKAIPLLTDLVNKEPGWGDGPMLLAEAYAGAGRTKDAIAWLESEDDPRLLPTLADFYERDRRWKDAADAYARALQAMPRNTELKTRYASALLNAGSREDIGKASDLLKEVVSTRANDARALYLLSQAQRRLGDYAAAESSARKVIAQNNHSPWGYYALAESLEDAHKYQSVIDEIAPVVNQNRGKTGDQAFDIVMLLPHLGFAYQELGQHDKAIASFEEARRLAPKDANVAGYLVEANLAAKKYAAAADLARAAVAEHPDNIRLLRLQAQALRHTGKSDQGVALLEESLKKHADDPAAYVALAQLYTDVDRGAQAIKLLQDAQTKFPDDTSIAFEIGAVYDKQKKFAEAESAFKNLLAREPDNSAALNYLGYMLAERGERLDESVSLINKALQLEPDNGSYLDSLGWAYYKADKLDLAETNVRRAAEQLPTNSVIQDHYGEILFKLTRYDAAIAAWNRALSGDGDSIDKTEIDKKIRAAKQKLGKK